MKLSLAMIVKNEAPNLGGCLDSVKGLVDEMVVVDTGSADGTVEIAESMGARVGRFAWTDDFSEARNHSLSLCSGDWILVLDADEMMDPKDFGAIREALLAPGAMGYNLCHKHYLSSGSHFGTGGNAKPNDGAFAPSAACSHYISNPVLRLVRNLHSPVFAGRVHEWLEPWFRQNGFDALDLDATIHHFGKINVQRDMGKQPMYLDLAKRDMAERPHDRETGLITHYNVVQSALALEDWATVLDSAGAYLKLNPNAPVQIFLGGATALASIGKPEEALDFIAPFELRGKIDPAVLTLKAGALYDLGRVQEAIDACLEAIDSQPGYTAPFIRLSRILDGEGDIEGARRILEAGLDQNTRDMRLWEALVGLSSKHRDARVAQDAWHAIQAVPNGGQGIWHMIVAQILKGQGDLPGAISVLAMGAAAFPCNIEIDGLMKKLQQQ